MSKQASWTFFRAGGFDQVALLSGGDLANLEQLDQKLWVALACPTSGIDLDSRFLSMLDADNDGRVRAPELLAAVKFARQSLKTLDDLLRGDDTLPLSAINPETEEGKLLLSAAKQVLTNLKKPDAKEISLADLEDRTKVFADTPFNGDGIITALSSDEESIRAVLANIIDCLGAQTDRSGLPGVNQETADRFFKEVAEWNAWNARGNADLANLQPLGEERTPSAVSAFLSIRPKVDDYFSRCRLAAFDARTLPLLNRPETEYAELAKQNLSANVSEAIQFPLAQIAPGKPLPLRGSVNPAFAEALKTLLDATLVPLIGHRDELSESDWESIKGRLSPHLKWQEEKPATSVEKLGAVRLRELADSDSPGTLRLLIEKDTSLAAEAQSLENVERLVRYYRYLFRLCTNFVNFRDFYQRKDRATFQCGTLYLDQRACSLCLPVADPAKHAAVAGLAGAYLAYVDCVRPATGEKMSVVAVVTDGDSDNLMVGRNGLFYDNQGRDYDATITKIVDNPISLRQSFFAPYKKLVRLIEEQVAKRASAADGESSAKLGTLAEGTVHVDKLSAPAPPKPVDVGAVAALGVAVAGVGSFFTAVMGYASGILKLGLLPTLAAFLGLVLLVSVPSVVLAYVKLRKRNLGPLLDASGWAINSQAKINVPFGATLTSLSKLPPGSKRVLTDQFEEQGLPWRRYLLLFLVLYTGYHWFTGSFDKYLPRHCTASGLFALMNSAEESAGNGAGENAK